MIDYGQDRDGTATDTPPCAMSFLRRPRSSGIDVHVDDPNILSCGSITQYHTHIHVYVHLSTMTESGQM